MMDDDDKFRPKLGELAYTREGHSYKIVNVIRRKGMGKYDVVVRLQEEMGSLDKGTGQQCVVEKVKGMWMILSKIHFKNIYK